MKLIWRGQAKLNSIVFKYLLVAIQWSLLGITPRVRLCCSVLRGDGEEGKYGKADELDGNEGCIQKVWSKQASWTCSITWTLQNPDWARISRQDYRQGRSWKAYTEGNRSHILHILRWTHLNVYVDCTSAAHGRVFWLREFSQSCVFRLNNIIIIIWNKDCVMSKRKGLSFEEKRSKLLEIFHESVPNSLPQYILLNTWYIIFIYVYVIIELNWVSECL